MENCSVPKVTAAVGFVAAAPVAPTGTTPTDISGVSCGTTRLSRMVLYPAMTSFDEPLAKFEYICTTLELFVFEPVNWLEVRRNPVFCDNGLFWNVLLFREKETLSVLLIN